jgi:23S rRNA (adenine2030-N6)-methyltransferase
LNGEKFFEAGNREDFFHLKRSFAGNQKISTLNQDGFALAKSKLPPLEKRGLVLIDPAFEKDQSKVSADYETIIQCLSDAHKRFAHGIYLLWHPIIKNDAETLKNFYEKIAALKFEKKFHAVFNIGSKTDETKMHSCGMFVFNAPWQLEEKLNLILPQILEVLQQGDDANFELKQL